MEGRNTTIQYRWAEGDYDRLLPLAAELVRLQPAVIAATGGTVTAVAAKAATTTIPIIMLSGADPVALGLIDSFSRPSGNVTGVAQLTTSLVEKRLQILRELAPAATNIGFLVNPGRPQDGIVARVEAAARALGQQAHVLRARSEGDLGPAFERLRAAGADALIVGPDPFFVLARKHIVALAAEYRVPTIYEWREYVDDGGLASYGTSLAEAYWQVGAYTGKILAGAKPADLPVVQQSAKLELVLNLRTARAMDLTIPASVLAQADEVIE